MTQCPVVTPGSIWGTVCGIMDAKKGQEFIKARALTPVLFLPQTMTSTFH